MTTMARTLSKSGNLESIERPVLDADHERALLDRVRLGDERARTELVGAHLRLVRAVARRVAPAPSEDALAEGVVGLLEAIERFDCSRGVRLATYATHWIRARVQQFVLANRGIVGAPDTRASRRVFGRLGRARRALAATTSEPCAEELAREIGVSVADVEQVLAAQARDVPIDTAHEAGVGAGATMAGPEDSYAEAEIASARRRIIGGVLASLPDRERRVVEARALAEDAQTLDQLAGRLALSRERVRQLEARALRRIGDALTLEGLAA